MASSSTSTQLSSCPIHNMVAYLNKPSNKPDFNEIIDFLKGSYIHYSLTVSPHLSQGHINEYWVNAFICNNGGQQQIKSKVAETEVVISESSIRSTLKLNDEEGIIFFNDQILYENLQAMGYEGECTNFTFQKIMFSPQWRFLIHIILHCLSSKKTAFEQFGTSIAYAIICLATGQKFNFSNLIFNGMIRNLKQKEAQRFLMYPRFVQLFLNEQINNLPVQDTILFVSQFTPKVFSNMLRQTPKFSGRVTALFPAMLAAPSATEEAPPATSEPAAAQNVVTPSTSQPTAAGGTTTKQGTIFHTYSRAKRAKTQVSEAHAAHTSQPMEFIPEQHVVSEEEDDHSVRAASTESSPLADQDRSNIYKTQTEATPRNDSTHVDDFGGPSTNSKGESADHTRYEAEDNCANDSSKKSHSDGVEASTNQELTAALLLFWSKFTNEKRKRRAIQQLVTSLQNEVANLKREVTELKQKMGESASAANEPAEKVNAADVAKETVAGANDDVEVNLDDDELIHTPPTPSESNPEVVIPEPQSGKETVRATPKRQKSIPVRRKVDQASKYKTLPKKKYTQPPLPPVTIREPTTTSGPSNLPTIDPKDKGKRILEEEPKKKKQKPIPVSHIEEDFELAQRLQAELNQQAFEEGLVKVEIDEGFYVQMTKEQTAEYDALKLKEKTAADIEFLQEELQRKRAADARKKRAAKPPTPAQRKKSLIARMRGGISLTRLKNMSLEELQRIWDNDTFLNPAARERKEKEDQEKNKRK